MSCSCRIAGDAEDAAIQKCSVPELFLTLEGKNSPPIFERVASIPTFHRLTGHDL